MNDTLNSPAKLVWEKPTMAVVGATGNVRSGAIDTDEDFTGTPLS